MGRTSDDISSYADFRAANWGETGPGPTLLVAPGKD